MTTTSMLLINGPAGAGKTTVALGLCEAFQKETGKPAIHLELDAFRCMVVSNTVDTVDRRMWEEIFLAATRAAFNESTLVVAEGLFDSSRVVDRIMATYPNVHLLSLFAPVEICIKRNGGRTPVNEILPEIEVTALHESFVPIGHLIDAGESAEACLASVTNYAREKCWPNISSSSRNNV